MKRAEMKKIMLHEIEDERYAWLVTVLEYEIRLEDVLAGLRLPSSEKTGKKVIVDMTLKSGMNSFRFAEFDTDGCGGIDLKSVKNVVPDAAVIETANACLKEKKEYVENSLLSHKAQNDLLGVR